MITEIAFILDRSGSMEAMRQAALDGFNEFLQDQQSAPGQARLTLALFDDELEFPCDGIPVAEVLPLNHDTFVPRGSTALLDAIGATIDRLVNRIKAAPADQRPGHVAIAILTDGEENSSRRFTWHDISARIAYQKTQHGWDFLFLGAGPDAIATAAKMNIGRAHSASFLADAHGQGAAMKSVSRHITSTREMEFTPEELRQLGDAAKPLSELVDEEDRKRRRS